MAPLPLTESIRGILGEALLAQQPTSARLVHAGRGAHLDMAALSRALDAGRRASAVLDVTDPEPLPPEHPLAVIRAVREGLPIPGLVALERGY